ncbi:hypothetical protein ACEN9Z_21630, partial [Stenotrophomonas geniculata]
DPNEIDTVAMARVITALNAIRMNDPDKLGDWFGRFITTYRAAGEVMAHQAAPAPEEVAQSRPAAGHGAGHLPARFLAEAPAADP